MSTQASDFTDGMRALMRNNEQKLAGANQELSASLDEVLSINANGKSDVVLLQQQFNSIKSKTDSLAKKKAEILLRLKFLSLMSSQNMITNANARESLPKILAQLAARDLSSSIEASVSADFWDFEINLGVAIKNSMEPTENPVTFIDEYLNWSSISEPKSPIEFITQARSYRGAPIAPTSKTQESEQQIPAPVTDPNQK